MRQVTTEHLTALLADHEPPCISLYQPTHRHFPANQQDPIRYRNLLKELEKSLGEKRPKAGVRSSLERFYALTDDQSFWNHRTDGLAILSSPEIFNVFELQRTVPERAIVADSFHTKPLVRIVQSADRYQVLSVGRHEAQLYEGNRDALDPIESPEVPATVSQALGEELTEPHLTVSSYGRGSGAPHAPHGEPSISHGHGSRKDETDIDRDRFFRAVDRAVLEHHSRLSSLPLILAALPEYHSHFRELSHNPFLMPEGIAVDPSALSIDQLRAQAWQVMEPYYRKRLEKLIGDYRLALSQRLGSDDVEEVAQAAIAGRVQFLLINGDKEVPGKLDATSGQIVAGDLAHPEIDDVLDDLATVVLKSKGEVVVLPESQLPSDSGLAAVYRY